MRSLLAIATIAIATLYSTPSTAFCGFFVGNTQGLYSDATQVALMRHKDQTVLSMRPQYSGPVEDFAMVVPVPEVLDKSDVATLTTQPFYELDKLSAPRLVEYHERDPCAHTRSRRSKGEGFGRIQGLSSNIGSSTGAKASVTVKAKFKRGEYEIVILDAEESTALEKWLNDNGYKQPDGASKYLAPYIQQGMYFFAAKVDVDRVTFEDGEAVLSPLQFRYTSETLKLPIRLGLLNANGPQDLVVFVLGRSRYRAAARNNVFIPTNLNVSHKRKEDFGEWYDALFERQLSSPQTVVTEYAWPLWMKCDPCPPGVRRMSARSIASLGGEHLGLNARDLVLTRLHTRYGPDGTTKDLIFEQAAAVAGGREHRVGGKLERGATEASRNAFQARYSIRFKWRGEITCENPRRGRWSYRGARTAPGISAGR